MVYSLFNCHKCTRFSHPILTFLTFHEMLQTCLQWYGQKQFVTTSKTYDLICFTNLIVCVVYPRPLWTFNLYLFYIYIIQSKLIQNDCYFNHHDQLCIRLPLSYGTFRQSACPFIRPLAFLVRIIPLSLLYNFSLLSPNDKKRREQTLQGTLFKAPAH